MRAAACLLGLSALVAVADARIHHLKITNDPRFAFSIESFGFESGGEMEIAIHDVKAEPADVDHKMGFVLFPAQSESNVAADIDSLIVKQGCALDYGSAQIYVIDISDPAKWTATINEKLAVEGGGMFDLLFTHCSPTENAKVSFSLDYTFRNPGPNYLSVGEIPLPSVYGFLAVLFATASGVWFWYCRRNRADIHKIHYLMSLMVVIKTCTLLFESVMYYFIAKTGHSTGWNVAYYVLTFIRGSLLVVIIALIGAGWSLLKPFLTDREKKVLMVVLPLQILNNIALIVVDEMDPGSQAFNAWTNVLHVADIVAAAAVLFPIVWSIKHLRDAQAADRGDEKAKDMLIRLTTFRSFYILTLGWLYFTRIVVYLIAASIAWDRQWLAPLVAELATLGYYLWTGYRFRPAPDNSDYLRVPSDDDGPAMAGAGLEMTATAPTSAAPIDDDDEEQAKGRTTAAATRAKAVPSQTVARTSIDKEAADFAANAAAAPSGEASGAASVPSKDAAAAPAKKPAQPAIADDEDDEFGLDEDDLSYELGVRPNQTAASSGLKKVSKD